MPSDDPLTIAAYFNANTDKASEDANTNKASEDANTDEKTAIVFYVDPDVAAAAADPGRDALLAPIASAGLNDDATQLTEIASVGVNAPELEKLIFQKLSQEQQNKVISGEATLTYDSKTSKVVYKENNK